MPIPDIKKSPQNYQLGVVMDNRYLAAKAEWDQRIGNARDQAYNWRRLALLCLSGLILAFLGLVFLGAQPKLRPYIVRVNSDGAAYNAGPIPPAYRPQLPEIKYFLAQFVQKTQTLPLDPVVTKKNWVEASAYLYPAAAAKLNSLVKSENLFGLIGQETREAEVNLIVPVSQNTYQVRWKMAIYNQEGQPVEKYNMTGMFLIDLVPPRDEKALKVNPLGLKIKDFNFAKEL